MTDKCEGCEKLERDLRVYEKALHEAIEAPYLDYHGEFSSEEVIQKELVEALGYAEDFLIKGGMSRCWRRSEAEKDWGDYGDAIGLICPCRKRNRCWVTVRWGEAGICDACGKEYQVKARVYERDSS